jgi:hypothetical protein
MRKLYSLLLIVLFASASVSVQGADRVLVVKPLYTVTSDVETNWGGAIGTVDLDPRYVLSKVEGSENLYSVTISLNQYFKTNKWKSSLGDVYAEPNEGWSNSHQFLIVYQDDYGNQTNSNPNVALNSPISFALESDAAITFYAVVNANGTIRAHSDAVPVVIGIGNNAAGGVTLPAAVGSTSSSNAIVIDGAGKIETNVNQNLLNPDNVTGKYAVYSRGRHVFVLDFQTIKYSIYKVLDAIQSPKFQIGTASPVNIESIPVDLGDFDTATPLVLGGSLTGVSTTTSPFTPAAVTASIRYEIIPEGEEDGTTGIIPLSTTTTTAATSAIWSSATGVDISAGLPNGSYTLKLSYETDSYNDVLKNDNDGEYYTTAFSINDSDRTLIESAASSDRITTSNGIIEVVSDNSTVVKLYNLSGQLLSHSVTKHFSHAVNKGVYILSLDGKKHKIIVK